VSPQFRIWADYTFTLAKDEIDRQELLRRPRHKASATTTWTPTDKVAAFGRIDDLFDKRWENPVGFLVPGFGAFGGIKVAIGG
jgi:vitamin B12 transporter